MATDERVSTSILEYQVKGLDTLTLSATKIIGSQEKVVASAITASGLLGRAVDSTLVDYKALADAAQSNQLRSDAMADTISTRVVASVEEAKVATQALNREYEDTEALLRQIEQSATAAGAAQVSAARTPVTTTGGGSGFGLGDARSIAGRAGGILALSGNSQIASAASSILGLTEALGPLGGAAAGAVALISVAEKEIEAIEARAKDFAQRQVTNAELVSSGATSKDVQERVDRLKAANQVVVDQLTTLHLYMDKLHTIAPDFASEEAARIRGPGDKIFDAITSMLQSVSDLTGEPIQDVKSLQAYIDQLTVSSTAYNTQVYDLNKLLQSGELAFNTAKAAAEEWQSGFKSSIKQGLEDTVTAVVDYFKAIEATRIDHISSLFDDLAAEGTVRDNIAAIELEIGGIHKEATTKSLAIEAERLTKRSEAETTANEQLGKIHTDGLDNIARIERTAFRSLAADTRQRDVDAYLRDRQTEQDALADQKTAEGKQVAQTQATEFKQFAIIEKADHDQLAALKVSEDAQVTVKMRSEQQQLTNLVNIQNAEVVASQNFGIGVVSAHEYMRQAIESETLSWAHRVANGVAAVLGGFTPLPAYQETSGGSGTAFANAVDNRIDARLRAVWE